MAVKAYYAVPCGQCALHPAGTHAQHRNSGRRHLPPGRSIRPQGTTIIEADDEVFFVAAAGHIRAVMSELQRLESYRRIMIVGGGNIGAGPATPAREALQRQKLHRAQPEAGEQLSNTHLEHTISSAAMRRIRSFAGGGASTRSTSSSR